MPVTREDLGSEVAYWRAAIRQSEAAFEPWRRVCKGIVERYVSEREMSGTVSIGKAPARLNVLYSNVSTTLPALVGSEPTPVVQRRYQDPDIVGRVASEVLQRILEREIEEDEFPSALEQSAVDLLLTARGVLWVRYEPDIRKDPQTGQEVVYRERSPVDFVYYEDFCHSVERTWSEVKRKGWVSRRARYTQEEGVRRFGAEKFKDVPLHKTASDTRNSLSDSTDKSRSVLDTADVYEVWDASTKRVLWLALDGEEEFLDEKEDPLRLEGFFPCPKPAYGTLGNGSLRPTPDYVQYRALAEQLDTLTARAAVIARAIKVKILYNSSTQNVAKLLGGDSDLEALPVSLPPGSTLTLAQAVAFLPVREYATALVGIYDAIERTKAQIYEVTGLSDIVRGSVDPREKLGQSRIKAQGVSRRLSLRQRAVERQARDTLRIKTEIISEIYDPATIREASGFDYLPEIMQYKDAQENVDELFEAVVTLIRDDKTRGFRVEVETGSTALPDDDREKESTQEFIGSVGALLQQGLPALQAFPQIAPLLGELVLTTVRAQRVGRNTEASFEQFVRELAEAVPEPGEQDQQAQQAQDQTAQALQSMQQQGAQMAQQGQQALESLAQQVSQALQQTNQRIGMIEEALSQPPQPPIGQIVN